MHSEIFRFASAQKVPVRNETGKNRQRNKTEDTGAVERNMGDTGGFAMRGGGGIIFERGNLP